MNGQKISRARRVRGEDDTPRRDSMEHVQTILDDDDESISAASLPRVRRPQPPVAPSALHQWVARLRGKSQFFWGVLVGVAAMSALFGVVIFLLFWKFTAS